MAYIYRAEIYCDDCGKAIRQRLAEEYSISNAQVSRIRNNKQWQHV